MIEGVVRDIVHSVIRNVTGINRHSGTIQVVLVPVLVSATIENAAPTHLILTFDIALDESYVPDAYAFTVLVNDIVMEITNISILGRVLTITLASEPPYGTIVSVSYFTVFVTSGNNWYRKGERDGHYVVDYSSDGGATWEFNVVLEPDEDSIIIAIDAGVTGYRQQVRGTALKIDHVLTPIGFPGTENIDWENVYTT